MTDISHISSSVSSSADTRARLNQTFDHFLKMLTTQLQNQDPTSPMDSNEFTSQLVQYTQVEQSIRTNDRLDTLIGMQVTSQISFAASMVGKTVEVRGNQAEYKEGDTIEFGYQMPIGAAAASLTITNSAGATVYAGNISPAGGKGTFAWDGTTTDGQQVPEGVYRVRVIAMNAEGDQAEVATTVAQPVTGVKMTDGYLELEMGQGRAFFHDVIAIREARQ